MPKRWGLLLALVCIASLAGNVYLYLELKPRPATVNALALAPSPSPADPHVVPSAGAPAGQAVTRQTSKDGRATAAPRPVRSAEECDRLRFEKNRAQLRDPAQRQQTKEDYVFHTRQGDESSGGLEDLHLSDEQLNRLYELAAEWFVQSAETYAPPRSRWPLDQNPLIAAELGDEVAQKWAKYQRESSGRWRVRELAGVMASEDVPLRADQRRQMIELYTALDEERVAEVRDNGIQSPTSEAEAIELHQGTKQRDVQYGQKLMDRAASILSAKQIDVLRRDSEHRGAIMERQWEQRRSQGELVKTDANGCVMSYFP